MRRVLSDYVVKRPQNLKYLLTKNPYFYVTLEKDKYKSEENKKFLIELVEKYHDLFPELPVEWKEDINIIARVINLENKDRPFQMYRNENSHSNVKNIPLILNEYKKPEIFLREIKNINMRYIRKIYPELSIEWRKDEKIIRSLFKERDLFEVNVEYCRSIPEVSLREEIIKQIKSIKEKKLKI